MCYAHKIDKYCSIKIFFFVDESEFIYETYARSLNVGTFIMSYSKSVSEGFSN